ncbi:MAG: trigger factor family protein [Bacteroidota bacterium]|nr:trigger factor family protein [Bacteroidota bacterium]
MNVQFKPIEEQHGFLHILLTSPDYEPKIKEELKKIRKTAHLKGFRQGAVPESYVDKLYGSSIRAEVLNKLIQETLDNYQKSNSLSFVGDIIPVNEPLADSELKEKEMEFVFEVGIAPQVDIHELLPKIELTHYTVGIPDDRVEEEMKHLRERLGISSEVDAVIQKRDIVELEITEMVNGLLKEDGIQSTFQVLLDDMATEEVISKLVGKMKNDVLEINIRQIEKTASDEDIRKYFLKLEDKETLFNDAFQAIIKKILRQEEAVMDEEFYKKAFGPNTSVTNEEDAKNEIRKNLDAYFAMECDKLLEIELVKKVQATANLKFPDLFLKKWLKQNFEEWKQEDSHEMEHKYYHFREGISWRLVRDHIANDQQFNVNAEEVYRVVIREMRRNFPGVNLPEESWVQLAQRALKDKDKSIEYYTEVLNEKAIQWLKNNLTISRAEISLDDFRERVKKMNSHEDHFHPNEQSHEHPH